jgi:Putative glutamine amidotransferase
MNFNIEFLPLLPWFVIIAFAVFAACLVSFMIYKMQRGSFLRAASAAILGLALTNPILRVDQRQALSDIAVVIVDQSTSQSFGKRTEQTQAALEKIKTRIAQLPNTELRVVNVTSGLTIENEGTRLFTALNRAVADIPADRFAAAFLLTDGEVHDVPQNIASLPSPIHSLITGSKSENDRRVVIDHAPRFGIVGQNQTIQFHIEDPRHSEAVSVTVQVPGEETKTLSVVPGGAAEISVNLNHAGQNMVEIFAAPREGELSLQNNHAVVVVEGIRDRLRVLLVSGQPHPGERTWRNLLKADTSVDLVHFTILRPPEKQDGTPTIELSLIAFPTRELFVDKLNKFDLVIFDRYRRQAILPDAYLSNVAEYVRKGGALLVSSGPDFADAEGLYSTPLAEVLPAAPTGNVTETPYQPALTDAGNRHPVTKDLPNANAGKPSWGKWFRLIDADAQPNAEVLLSGPDKKPLLVLNHVEQGRVAQLLSDHGWLWSRGFDGGGPQTELLRRMAHWAMKEPDLEEEFLSGKQVGNQIIIERRSMAASAKPVTVTSPSGVKKTLPLTQLKPGLFVAQMPISEAGIHTLSDGTLQAAAAIGNGDAKEATDIRATEAILQPVSKATGGGLSWLENGMPNINKASPSKIMAGSGWMSLRENGQFRVTSISEVPLFSTLLSLAVLLMAASLLWYREGR